MITAMILEVKNLVKKFGKFTAVDDISFSMEGGEILGFLGPNGAGKTTTIHMLLGLITPTTGEISIFGKSLEHHREEILQDVNFTSPYVELPYRNTVYENLNVFCKLYNIPGARERIDHLLKLFDVSDLRSTAMTHLSAGEKTRVGLCKAFLNKPRLLLLDEPTASLDPYAAAQAVEVIRQAQREEGITVLYTSHNMAEVERLCNRIIFLNHGKIIAQGSPTDITGAILQEERNEPSLEEVFIHVVKSTTHEVV